MVLGTFSMWLVATLGCTLQPTTIDFEALESIVVFQQHIWLYTLKINFASRIDFGRSEKFLLSVRITFRKTTKYKSLYLKINFNKINSNKTNSIKAEPNIHLVICHFFIGFVYKGGPYITPY